MSLLEGRVAIVSGVGPGLGQANAKALAREGATVVLATRSADYLAQTADEIVADGGNPIAVPTNITDRVQCDALAQRCLDDFGRLDVLVNNAFRASQFRSFEAADLAKWRKIHDVNVWGTLELTQACVPGLKQTAAAHGDAAIVFILSMSQRKIRADEIDYSSSKGALRTAMQGLAYELGPDHVPRQRGRAGLDRRPVGGDVPRLDGAGAQRRRERDRRRARGRDPAPRDPAAGRHRQRRGVLRVALEPCDHRSDARRQRW